MKEKKKKVKSPLPKNKITEKDKKIKAIDNKIDKLSSQKKFGTSARWYCITLDREAVKDYRFCNKKLPKEPMWTKENEKEHKKLQKEMSEEIKALLVKRDKIKREDDNDKTND